MSKSGFKFAPIEGEAHPMEDETANQNGAEFDAFASDYDAALSQGLRIVGEAKEYFVARRAKWLAMRIHEAGMRAERVLDFGCGAGGAMPYLRRSLGAELLYGVDVSRASLELARRTHASFAVRFLAMKEWQPDREIDVAYCNGVFHHIPLGERTRAARYVYTSLRPGGLFALWENNPWNPGTRFIMSRVPFDRDAVTLTPPQTRSMLRDVGFEVIRTDFLFIFPRVLAWLRGLEPLLSGIPLGGQYMVLARRPT